jgi:hypothetical protein
MNLPNKHRRFQPLVVAFCGLSWAACATGGRAFPPSNEAVPHAIGRAMAAITEAVAAGADSLASEPLKTARQRLSAATAEQQAKHEDRAGLLAREAIVEASYARAVAERYSAERARAAAAAQLEQLSTTAAPGPGSQP